ncbi:MED6 [Candida theae]|uniref:Mediator of RNA polymerase II transcription subunit 6 n=1 Tax=Candida theae TaxID=1198502 RepID=A0AAD5BBL7_9ASCO|nr:MED6 [Candida theae]KAI5949479.1 MED6 [Candida theae]
MEALDEIQWKSPEFIQERGLNTANVLEYFALSPFYDRTSNNQVLMMQFQYQQIQIPVHVSFHQYFQSRLSEMTGIEFVIAFIREPDFWIIRKQNRLNPTNVIALQDYYIIGANIYQAPKVYDVLSSRLLATVLSLKSSVDTLNNMTSYHISDGAHSFNNSIHGNTKNATPTTATATTTATTTTTTTTSTSTPGQSNSDPTPISDLETPIAMIDSPAIGAPASIAVTTPTQANSTVPSAAAFDTLLTEAVNDTTNKNYLEDIPLYGKGSTLESLGVKSANPI